MKITIDESVCKKHDMKLSEVLAILLIKSCGNVADVFENLEKKGAIVRDLFSGDYLITNAYDDKSNNIILSADPLIPDDKKILPIAEKMIALFPSGKKPGTTVYWKGNKKDISLKLKKFFKLYGGDFTEEQILSATKRYIEMFNGDYSNMRILKYFIWKEVRKIDSEGVGYIEPISDLATMIENEGGDLSINSDWTSQLF